MIAHAADAAPPRDPAWNASAPRHGVVRVDLRPSADIAMITDREPSFTIENDVGTDPAMLPHFYIAEDQDIVVAGRAFAKSVITGDFPSIGQQITN